MLLLSLKTGENCVSSICWKRFEVIGVVDVQCLSPGLAVCFGFFE